MPFSEAWGSTPPLPLHSANATEAGNRPHYLTTRRAKWVALALVASIISTGFFLLNKNNSWKPTFMPLMAQSYEDHHEEDGYFKVGKWTYLNSNGKKIKFWAKDSSEIDCMTIWYEHQNEEHVKALLDSARYFANMGNYLGEAHRDINTYAIKRCINADWDKEPIGAGSELNGGSIYISKFVLPKQGTNTRELRLQEKRNH